MIYIKVQWKHDFQDEPIFLYSELNKNRNEVRKVEVYRNDTFGYACVDAAINGTFLSKYEIPELNEINADKQFQACEIEKEEFELVWNEAIEAKCS